MKRKRTHRGVLTIEASISYSIFLMITVTVLYLMRIVYVYGLIQHAAAQTAKELSMYSYLYQAAGVNDLNQQISGATGKRTGKLNQDMSEVIQFYQDFSSGDMTASYNGTTDPKEILKNIGAAALNQAGREVNHQLFEAVARPLMESYIGADSLGNPANDRLEALRVIGGLSGLNLNSSSFFEDGETIDLVVCYTIDPVMPIDILPEINLANRACIRGMSGKSVFHGSNPGPESKKGESIWDQKSSTKRGTVIQEQEQVRNLPERFPVFSAFDSDTGRAAGELSIDIRDVSYQDKSRIEAVVRSKCKKIDQFKDTSYGGVSIKKEDIKSRELIVYIPSTTADREIDRTKYDQAIKTVQAQYPDIQLITKEID